MPTTKPKKRKSKKGVDEVKKAEDTEPGADMKLQSRRNPSESRDPPTPDPHNASAHRKKKRKKALDLERERGLNGDAQETHPEGDQGIRKFRRKRKSKIKDHHQPSDLEAEDDFVADAYAPISHRSLFSAPLGHSQPLSKVFVERNRRFQAADRLDLGTEHLEDFMEVRSMWSTRDVALRVHSSFRIIGLFSHGFLSGCAVWNVIVLYVLAGEDLKTLPNLLQQYHSLVCPAQSLLYLLLTISTVSAFDRVNLAKASMALRGLLTLDPAAVASFLYFAALILSLSQQMTSDRINLYSSANDTLWPPGSEHQTLQPWIVVNLVVALLVGLAWVFISTRPDLDYTEEFLIAMEVEENPRHPRHETEITS